MKEMTLKDIQKVSLDILRDVHDYCINENIRYSLAYGTLIGAIRHQGYIPWDDDIDIIMPRSDYERFCSRYHSDRFVIRCPKQGNTKRGLARIYDDKRTVGLSDNPWNNIFHSVWIDVFPVDGLESDLQLSFKRRTKAAKLVKIVNRQAMLSTPLSFFSTPFKKLKHVIKRIIYFRPPAIEKLERLCSEIDYDKAEYFGKISTLIYYKKEHHRKECWTDTIVVPFEDAYFCIMNGYDEWLRDIYGDYMQLPPENERVPKHVGGWLYWKAD